MAAPQIKKHKIFLSSQATQHILNISYQKRERKPVINTHQTFSTTKCQVPISWLYEENQKKTIVLVLA